jgi:hypothetical protein
VATLGQDPYQAFPDPRRDILVGGTVEDPLGDFQLRRRQSVQLTGSLQFGIGKRLQSQQFEHGASLRRVAEAE